MSGTATQAREADCRPGPDDVANAVVELIRADIAPHIESALLDRIEEKVKGLEAPEVWSEPIRHGFGAALKRVSALLSEIREEAAAQSGEGQ